MHGEKIYAHVFARENYTRVLKKRYPIAYHSFF